MAEKQQTYLEYLLFGILAFLIVFIAFKAKPQSMPGAQSTGPSQGSASSVPLSDFPQTFMTHLQQMGVPVKRVRSKSASPDDIEIVIQADFGEADHADVWYTVLTTREVKNAYLNFGIRLRSATIDVLNSKNETVNGNSSFLDSGNTPLVKIPYPPALVDDQTAGSKLVEFLDTEGLKLISVEVPANFSALYASRAAILKYSILTTDQTLISDRMEALATHLVAQVRDFNATLQSHFWLLWVKVTDGEGNLVLEMAADVDGYSLTWHADYIEFKSWPRPAMVVDEKGNPLITMEPGILQTPTPQPGETLSPAPPPGMEITLTPIPPYPAP